MSDWDGILKIAQQNPDIVVSGENLSAAVSNGPTGRQEIEWANGPDLSSTGHVSLDTMPVPSEHDEQAALFAWQAVKRNEWPELAMLYANVNGQYRPGQRAEPGLIKGVPDVTMAVPSDANGRLYHGMYIELKRRDRRGAKDGGLSAAQVEWVEHLRRWGYYVAVCYGAGEAIDTITEYLGR